VVDLLALAGSVLQITLLLDLAELTEHKLQVGQISLKVVEIRFSKMALRSVDMEPLVMQALRLHSLALQQYLLAVAEEVFAPTRKVKRHSAD
jgi:hypothetical protein